MRQILAVHSAPRPHWVGDGFPVRTLLSHHDHGEHISPFIMLDYAGPAKFEPTKARRGVGVHPHKGFETVTIVYEGEVEHRDSTGAGGLIGPGDVQWMTAASGILHEEYHSPAFAEKGGNFEMVQLWVNLPARDKMARSRLSDAARCAHPCGRAAQRVPARCASSPVNSATSTARREPSRRSTFGTSGSIAARPRRFDVPEGHTLSVLVLSGTVEVNGQEIAREAQTVLLDRKGGGITIEANSRRQASRAHRRADQRAGRRPWAVRHEHCRRDQAGHARLPERQVRRAWAQRENPESRRAPIADAGPPTLTTPVRTDARGPTPTKETDNDQALHATGQEQGRRAARRPSGRSALAGARHRPGHVQEQRAGGRRPCQVLQASDHPDDEFRGRPQRTARTGAQRDLSRMRRSFPVPARSMRGTTRTS